MTDAFLANTDNQVSIQKLLFHPHLIQFGVGRPLDAADELLIAHKVRRRATAMNLIGVGKERCACPAGQLFQIKCQAGSRQAVIHDAAPQPAGHVAP